MTLRIRQQLQFSRRMATASSIGIALVIGLLLWMVFWGADDQASMAVVMIKYVATALGGAGIYVLIKSLVTSILSGDGTP